MANWYDEVMAEIKHGFEQHARRLKTDPEFAARVARVKARNRRVDDVQFDADSRREEMGLMPQEMRDEQ